MKYIIISKIYKLNYLSLQKKFSFEREYHTDLFNRQPC